MDTVGENLTSLGLVKLNDDEEVYPSILSDGAPSSASALTHTDAS